MRGPPTRSAPAPARGVPARRHPPGRRTTPPLPPLDLLLTGDPREANRIAWELNGLNSERQRRTRYAVERAMEEVDPEQDFKVVVTDETGGLAGLGGGRAAGGA